MHQNSTLQVTESSRQLNQYAVRLNIVLANDQFAGSLHLLEFNSLDSGEIVMRKLRLLYYHRLMTRWTRFRVHGILCRRVIIETASLDVGDLMPEVQYSVLNKKKKKKQ